MSRISVSRVRLFGGVLLIAPSASSQTFGTRILDLLNGSQSGIAIGAVGRIRRPDHEGIDFLMLFRGPSNEREVESISGLSVYINRRLAGVVPSGTKLRCGRGVLLAFSERDAEEVGRCAPIPCVVCVAGGGHGDLEQGGLVEVRSIRGEAVDAIRVLSTPTASVMTDPGSDNKAPEVVVDLEEAGGWTVRRQVLDARPTPDAPWDVLRGGFLRMRGASHEGMFRVYMRNLDGRPVPGAQLRLGSSARVLGKGDAGGFAMAISRPETAELGFLAEADGYLPQAAQLFVTDAANMYMMHIELARARPSVESQCGAAGATIVDPRGLWRVEVPAGALDSRCVVRVRPVGPDPLWARIGSDDSERARPLRRCLPALEISAEPACALGKPLRVWFSLGSESLPEGARFDTAMDLVRGDGVVAVCPVDWSASTNGVEGRAGSWGRVVASVQPKTKSGRLLVARRLGSTLDSNWDGAVGPFDWGAFYWGLGPGDGGLVSEEADYTVRWEPVPPTDVGDDGKLVADLVSRSLSDGSALDLGGAIWTAKVGASHGFQVPWNTDGLVAGANAKVEVGAFPRKLIVKISVHDESTALGEGKALGIMLVPWSLDATVRSLKN